MEPILVLAPAVAVAGATVAAIGMRQRSTAPSLAQSLAEIDGVQATAARADLSQPLLVRLLRPLAGRVAQKAAGLLPSNHLEKLRRRLVRAGLASRLRAEELLALQAAAVAGGVVLAGLVASSPTVAGPRRLAAAVLSIAIGVVAPSAWLSRQREARVLAIRNDLPDVLDLLAISVEAGIGLEGAIEVVTDRFSTPLARELSHTLQEMRLGRTRRDALHHLRDRVDVPELSSFVLSLVQADALGTPLSRVLRAQAAEMRTRRRQQARERAAKLPVKLLFPTVLFILPAIFIVTLGPAGLRILEVLG
ncbi:MAG TPA: type II secretion system F family protein [Nitriliruptorales bacterium]